MVQLHGIISVYITKKSSYISETYNINLSITMVLGNRKKNAASAITPQCLYK